MEFSYSVEVTKALFYIFDLLLVIVTITKGDGSDVIFNEICS